MSKNRLSLLIILVGICIATCLASELRSPCGTELASDYVPLAAGPAKEMFYIADLLASHGISCPGSGSVGYGLSVLKADRPKAIDILKSDKKASEILDLYELGSIYSQPASNEVNEIIKIIFKMPSVETLRFAERKRKGSLSSDEELLAKQVSPQLNFAGVDIESAIAKLGNYKNEDLLNAFDRLLSVGHVKEARWQKYTPLSDGMEWRKIPRDVWPDVDLLNKLSLINMALFDSGTQETAPFDGLNKNGEAIILLGPNTSRKTNSINPLTRLTELVRDSIGRRSNFKLIIRE